MAVGSPSAVAPAVPVRYRRNISRLTSNQLRDLRRGFSEVQAIGDDRGYAYHAGIHGLPVPIGCDNAHGTPFFLPWHRAYLYFFERALRDRVASISLAWWNWQVTASRPPAIPTPFADAQDTDGADNPLASAEISVPALQQGGRPVPARTVRRPGSASRLPDAAEVRAVLELRDFLDFTAHVEALHDRVHMWTGGDMGQIVYAAFDPIFWAHHCMIDRLWRLWQLGHTGATPPQHLLDEALPPFRMTVRQTLDVTALGYDYAVASASQQSGG
jgi:tyrosinase